nr:MAG TPA: hypothetical protein [Caudoviricetes sp.]
MNFLTVSFQPSRIDKRLFKIKTFLAFLCLQISRAQIVLPRPPRASKKIPFVSLSLRFTASFCHFLSCITIFYHHPPDI